MRMTKNLRKFASRVARYGAVRRKVDPWVHLAEDRFAATNLKQNEQEEHDGQTTG